MLFISKIHLSLPTGAAADIQKLDLIKLLNERPWLSAYNTWNQHPQFDADMPVVKTQPFDLRRLFDPQRLASDRVILDPKIGEEDDSRDERRMEPHNMDLR